MKRDGVLPWSVPLRLDDIGSGVERRLVADDAVRARIAKALGLEGLKTLEADLRVRSGAEHGSVSGAIRAEVVYLCGVTLEPFESLIEAEFEDHFTTRAPDLPAAGEELGLADLDTPDFIEGGVIDLGGYIVEQLALEIDPFPRKPGAVFEPPVGEEPPSPFEALAALKPRAGKD
jgi:hypothetical protein